MSGQLKGIETNQNNIDEPADTAMDKKDVILMQQFASACVALLKMLREHSEQKILSIQNDTDPNHQVVQVHSKFNEKVDKYIMSLQNGRFDFNKTLRKIYEILRPENVTTLVRDMDISLFELRNDDNKIVSIIPGINIKLVYPLLSESDRVYFWQYFHLMTLTTFNIFHLYNPKKVETQKHVMEMIHDIGSKLEKTGIMVDDKIFNPYLGLGSDDQKYSMADMFKNTDDLQTGEQLSLEAMLNTLGVGNLVNEKELNAKLESLQESDLEIATDQIVNILGAGGDPNARDTCGKLVRNIVEQLKINGIGNVGNVLKSVADKSRSEIHVSEMQNTMGYVQNFMTDGQDKLKDLKDEHGNPVGEQVLNTISAPMAMMKAMGLGVPPQNNDSNGSDN
jgi:hypothetical protein